MDEFEKGRKFTRVLWSKYLGYLSKGVGKVAAAKAVGVNHQCILNHVNDDPNLKKEMDEAISLSWDAVENALFKNATQRNSFASQSFFLCNKKPDEWKDRRQVNTVNIIPSEVNNSNKFIDETLERRLDADNKPNPEPPSNQQS